MSLQPFPILQDLPGRVVSGDSGYAATRVRRRAALIESFDRGAIIRIMRCRALEEQLLERQLAMEDVALRRVYNPLDVMGQEYLALNDAVAESQVLLPQIGRAHV